MDVSQTMETEEDLLTCLHIKLYHPKQASQAPYRLLPLGNKQQYSAEDPLKLGRDAKACTLALVDPRVSRKNLALQAYRTPQSKDMLFTLQNLSQKGQMTMNGSVLGYLERMDLPDKALIRFGEYEVMIIRVNGEAKGMFEVDLEILASPPSRETGVCVPSMIPVMDTCTCVTTEHPAELRVRGPSETDETYTFS